jgi:uncharacterized protein
MTVLGIQSEGLVVVGEAVRSAAPDMVELTVGAQNTATSVTQALRDNAARMLHVVQAFAAMGISQADIETTGLSVYPLYSSPYQQAGQPQPAGLGAYPQTGQGGIYGEVQPIVGYYVSSSVKVSLRDASRSGELLDAAIGAGANFCIGLSFRLRDESTVRRATLEAASKDAQAKAETVAAAVGKRLGDPVTVAADTFSPTRGGGLMGTGQPAPQGFLGAPLAGTNITPMAVSPGELTFGARVQILYQLL